MNLRILYNVVLVRLGIRFVLPHDYVLSHPVEDCGEELIEIPDACGLRVDRDSAGYPAFGRRSVVEKLVRIGESLWPAHYLLVKSAYRTLNEQNIRWQRALDTARRKYPDATAGDCRSLARRYSADPTENVGGGHQTGAAVDVQIRTTALNIDDPNYGTEYGDHSFKTHTQSRLLTETERMNRKKLCSVMEAEGFINYPGEWWHFSYGDQMWAAYGWKKKAIYGWVSIHQK